MSLYQRTLALILVWTVAAGTVGCTSVKTIQPATSPGAPIFGNVKAGDTVIVRPHDGRRVQFVDKEIDGDVLVGRNGGRYQRADIASLQRRSVSVWKTSLLTAA